jgi:hypothetical protein
MSKREMNNKIDWYNKNGDYPDASKPCSNDNWLCLHCCKVFRHNKMLTIIPSCTTCSKELINFGSQFKAPRKGEKNKWKELKKIVEHKNTKKT